MMSVNYVNHEHSQMKDSGVPWIGAIPSSWSVSPCKAIADIQAGFPFESDLFSNNEGFPLIRIRDITSGKIETYYNGPYPQEFVVRKGDLLIGMDGEYRVRWWDSVDALLNQRCCRIILEDSTLRKFLFYQIPISLRVVNEQTYSTTVKHLSNDDVRNLSVFIPSSKEELAEIVEYLDRFTVCCDKIISLENDVISELNKLKMSIVTETVTKGLNPEVPMKDSGIQWIGEIPESWEIIKLKNLGELYSGGVDKKIREGESQYRSIHYMDVYRNSLRNLHDSSDFLTVSCPSDKVDKCRLLPGDILFTTSSETPDDIGHSTLICDLMDDVLFGYHLIRFRPGNKILPSFAKYVFGSTSFRSWLSYRANGMTRYGVDNESFSVAYVQVPPLDVQVIISEYLDSICHTIDSLITLHESIIDSISEFKSSVIYEYVTGKKSVSEEVI